MKKYYGTVFLILGLLIFYFYMQLTTGSICIINSITGFPCPGCGLTRAGISLLKLDFVNSLKLHPFLIPTLVFLIYYFYYFVIKKNRKFSKPLKILTLIYAVAFFLFYIYRMINYFPNVYPMIYNSNSFIARLLEFLFGNK